MSEPQEIEIVGGKLQHYFPDSMLVVVTLGTEELERILTAIQSHAEILAEAISDLGKDLG